MGLATSVNRIKDSKAKSKVIILLTDGVNNAGFIDPVTAAELAKEFQIKIYSIGLGTNVLHYPRLVLMLEENLIMQMFRLKLMKTYLLKFLK